MTSTFLQRNETSVDPGWSLIVATLVTCLLLGLCLPCVVSLGSRYEQKKKRRQRNHSNKKKPRSIIPRDDDNDGDDDEHDGRSRSSSHEKILIVDDIDKALSTDAFCQDDTADDTSTNDGDDDVDAVEGERISIVEPSSKPTSTITSVTDWFCGIAEMVRADNI